MNATPFSLLFQPRRTWQQLADHMPASLGGALIYPIALAILPAVAWYIGTTRAGWEVGSTGPVRLTPDSATWIVALFYLTMIVAVAGIGYMVHWMAQTYGASSTVARGIALAGFTATPLFIAGVVGLHPHFLIDLTVGLLALAYAVYLLYLGIPIVMKIPEERGFLFASAVIAVCMVFLIAIMGLTVILWDMGAEPVFISN